MGEPLHNEANLYRVLKALSASELFHHPPRRIMVSTVGIPDGMIRCAQRFPEVNLALSLHTASQKVRERITPPMARRYPLEKLRAALRQIGRIQPGTVMIEYLMLAGVNDSPDDARQLNRVAARPAGPCEPDPVQPDRRGPRAKSDRPRRPRGLSPRFSNRPGCRRRFATHSAAISRPPAANWSAKKTANCAASTRTSSKTSVRVEIKGSRAVGRALAVAVIKVAGPLRMPSAVKTWETRTLDRRSRSDENAPCD